MMERLSPLSHMTRPPPSMYFDCLSLSLPLYACLSVSLLELLWQQFLLDLMKFCSVIQGPKSDVEFVVKFGRSVKLLSEAAVLQALYFDGVI